MSDNISILQSMYSKLLYLFCTDSSPPLLKKLPRSPHRGSRQIQGVGSFLLTLFFCLQHYCRSWFIYSLGITIYDIVEIVFKRLKEGDIKALPSQALVEKLVLSLLKGWPGRHKLGGGGGFPFRLLCTWPLKFQPGDSQRTGIHELQSSEPEPYPLRFRTFHQ